MLQSAKKYIFHSLLETRYTSILQKTYVRLCSCVAPAKIAVFFRQLENRRPNFLLLATVFYEISKKNFNFFNIGLF